MLSRSRRNQTSNTWHVMSDEARSSKRNCSAVARGTVAGARYVGAMTSFRTAEASAFSITRNLPSRCEAAPYASARGLRCCAGFRSGAGAELAAGHSAGAAVACVFSVGAYGARRDVVDCGRPDPPSDSGCSLQRDVPRSERYCRDGASSWVARGNSCGGLQVPQQDCACPYRRKTLHLVMR